MGGGSWRGSLSLLSLQLWLDSAQAGGGPPSVQLLSPAPHCCSCLSSINLIQGWEEGGGPGKRGPLGCVRPRLLWPLPLSGVSSCRGRGLGCCEPPPRRPGLLGKLWAVGGSSFHPPKQGHSFTEKNRDEFFLHLHREYPAACGTSYFTVLFMNKSGNDPTTFRMGRWAQAGDEGDRSSFWPDGLMWWDSGGM